MTTKAIATTRPATFGAALAATDGRARQVLLGLAAVLAGAAVLTISAKVQVPFWPVPMTLQTLAVLVIGMAFGARLATATVAFYLLQGAFGLPVFAGTPERGIGLAYMVGPTGGYLLGFLAAAWLLGWMAERGWSRSILNCLVAMTLGHALILGLGVAWLAASLGWTTAIAVGLTPFWAATLVKTLLGAAIMPGALAIRGKLAE